MEFVELKLQIMQIEEPVKWAHSMEFYDQTKSRITIKNSNPN